MELIGLTGLNASGKGTVADILKEKGYFYFSLSDAVREYATEKGRDHSRESLIVSGNELRALSGPSVLAIKALIKIKSAGARKAVIDSIRNPYEVEELRRVPGFYLIGVDAPVRIRFERAKKRGRIGFESDLNSFIEVEQKENSADPKKQQLFECLKMADKVIINDGTIEDLKKKLEDVPGYSINN